MGATEKAYSHFMSIAMLADKLKKSGQTEEAKQLIDDTFEMFTAMESLSPGELVNLVSDFTNGTFMPKDDSSNVDEHISETVDRSYSPPQLRNSKDSSIDLDIG